MAKYFILPKFIEVKYIMWCNSSSAINLAVSVVQWSVCLAINLQAWVWIPTSHVGVQPPSCWSSSMARQLMVNGFAGSRARETWAPGPPLPVACAPSFTFAWLNKIKVTPLLTQQVSQWASSNITLLFCTFQVLGFHLFKHFTYSIF